MTYIDRLRDEIVAPAVIEADMILSEDKRPGWYGNIGLKQQERVIYVHDHRPSFGFFDTCRWGGNFFSPQIVHHHHNYTTIERPKTKEEKEEQNETALKVLRVVVGVVAVAGLYFVAHSAAYAYAQMRSAESKIAEMKRLIADNEYCEFFDTHRTIKTIVDAREMLLQPKIDENYHRLIAYTGGAAGLALVGVGAIFASYNLAVAGVVVGTAALFYHGVTRSFVAGSKDPGLEKRLAQQIKVNAEKLKEQQLYPDIEQMEREFKEFNANDNRWAPSAPPMDE